MTNSRQHDAPEETSTHCRNPPLPEKTITQHQSESPINQIPYAPYQSGEMVSTMDFELPGSPESASDSGQLLDLEQQMIPVSEASFDNAGTAFLPENLCMRQDLVAYREFPSQDYSSLVYEFPQQQPPLYQAQAAQPSRTRAEAEVSRPALQTHHPFPSTQPSPMRTEAEVSRPLLQTRHAHSPAQSSPTRAEADTESNLAQSALPETPDSTPDAEDLEARFERVIKAVQEAGFEGIDDMSAQYYTATFKEDTVSHWAQSRSRSRSLHAFLASLHASTDNWSDREIQGYRQQIMEAAESFSVSELSDAREDIIQNEDRRSLALGENASSPVSQTATSVQSLWQTIAEMELSQDLKQKKRMLREKVCFPITLDISLNSRSKSALFRQLIREL